MNGVYQIGFLSGDMLDFGGVETHLLSIFRSLQNTEFQSILIAPASNQFIRQAEALNVHCVFWDPQKYWGIEKIRSLQSVLRENHLSLLHIHSPSAAIWGRIAAYKCGFPTVLTIHLHPIDYFSKSTIKQKLKLLVYSLVDCALNYTITEKIIYVSGRTHAYDVRRRYTPQKRSIVIANGVSLMQHVKGERINIRKVMGASQDCIVLCFVGRIEQQKGLDFLIKSLGFINKNILNNLELWIIGSGSAQLRIEALSCALGLQNNIRFIGYQDDVRIYLRGADIFILPSNFEAMSISLLEAMAQELPSIVTNTGENAQLIKNGGNGFVVPVGDIQSLATSITNLVENPVIRKRMGLSARNAVQIYSEDAMLGKVHFVYRSVIYSKKGDED